MSKRKFDPSLEDESNSRLFPKKPKNESSSQHPDEPDGEGKAPPNSPLFYPGS